VSAHIPDAHEKTTHEGHRRDRTAGDHPADPRSPWPPHRITPVFARHLIRLMLWPLNSPASGPTNRSLTISPSPIRCSYRRSRRAGPLHLAPPSLKTRHISLEFRLTRPFDQWYRLPQAGVGGSGRWRGRSYGHQFLGVALAARDQFSNFRWAGEDRLSAASRVILGNVPYWQWGQPIARRGSASCLTDSH
jgi:hypothetical protein